MVLTTFSTVFVKLGMRKKPKIFFIASAIPASDAAIEHISGGANVALC